MLEATFSLTLAQNDHCDLEQSQIEVWIKT